MDYKAQGPEKCTASILFDSTFGRPLYSSGMQFLLTTSLWWKWGKGAWRLTLSVIPSFGGRRVLYTAAIGSFHPPLRPSTPPPTARRVSGLCVEVWDSGRPGSCFLRFVCPSAFYTPCPITLPQTPCILTLTRLRTLRGSFRSYSV